jgi:protein SCO1
MNKNPAFFRNRWFWQSAGFLIGIILIISLGVYLRPHPFGGSALLSPQPAFPFKLEGSGSNPVALQDFNGKVVLLLFGYTSSPDITPLMLDKMHDVLKLAGQHADGIQVIMISIDPLKDTADVTDRYVKLFDPSFVGLTGNLDEIQTISRQYNVQFQKRSYNEAGGYLIDQTAKITLIDSDGFLMTLYPQDVSPRVIADDCIYLLSR